MRGVDLDDLRFAAFRRAVAEGSRDPRIQRIALALAGVAADPSHVPPELARAIRDGDDGAIRLAQARALLKAVQGRVSYVLDAPLQLPFDCWSSGQGDCKSSAVLLCALALSIGCPANLIAMGWNGAASHVVCVLCPVPSKGWLWAETTLNAELGEHPSSALARDPNASRRDVAGVGVHAPSAEVPNDAPNEVNARIVQEANRVVGLYADTDFAAFKDLVAGPNESDLMATAMAMSVGTSTCGLVVGGIWRRAGIQHPSLDPPYKLASAISRLYWDIALPLNAWTKDPNYEPKPGDMLALDIDKNDKAHVNTIVKVESTPTGWKLDTVDGGALSPHGAQGVAARTHYLTRDSQGLASSSSIGVTHRVTGFVNVARLLPLLADSVPSSPFSPGTTSNTGKIIAGVGLGALVLGGGYALWRYAA